MIFLTRPLSYILFHSLKTIGWKKTVFETNKQALNLDYDYHTTLKNLCVESASIICGFRTKNISYQIDTENRRLLDQMKNNKSILLTAHISNQEFLGAVLKKEGVDLRAYHQELQSPFWNNLLNSYRIKNGDYSPYSINNLKDALKEFKISNYTIAFLWDQHNSSHKNKFFSLNKQPYSPNRIPYQFNNLSDNIFIGTLFRQGESYVIQIKKIHSLDEYPQELERLINSIKNQWFGIFHKIFKTHINY